MLSDKKTWVLTDTRTGNDNQAIALANILQLQYEIQPLRYNTLARLPNQLGLGLTVLKNKKALISQPMPDIIISAGRRCAAIAVALKQQAPGLRIIQIMHPNISLKHFDIIILPKHDHKPKAEYLPKTILVNGAISFYPMSERIQDKIYWEKKFTHLPRPRIGVLIGGPSKSCTFTLAHAKELMDKLLAIANDMKASLLINTSRRTPSEVCLYMKKYLSSFKGQYFLNDISTQTANPFRGILTTADLLVVTGDSISMCSEAAEMGKPLYVFLADGQLGKKHTCFIEGLFADGVASKLSHPFNKQTPPPNNMSDWIREQVEASYAQYLKV